MKSLVPSFVFLIFWTSASGATQTYETEYGSICVVDGLIVSENVIGNAFGSITKGIFVEVPYPMEHGNNPGRRILVDIAVAKSPEEPTAGALSDARYDAEMELNYARSESPRGILYWDAKGGDSAFRAFCSEFEAVLHCSRTQVFKDGLAYSYLFEKSFLKDWRDFDGRIAQIMKKKIFKCQ